MTLHVDYEPPHRELCEAIAACFGEYAIHAYLRYADKDHVYWIARIAGRYGLKALRLANAQA